VPTLNARINSFVYGYAERRHKPSSNFSEDVLARNGHALSQKAVQMWCLMRCLPFLIQDLVPDDDPYMDIYLLFLRICTIILSPKLIQTHLAYLHDLQTEYQRLRLDLFPGVNPINRDHHTQHYVEWMLKMGPINDFS